MTKEEVIRKDKECERKRNIYLYQRNQSTAYTTIAPEDVRIAEAAAELQQAASKEYDILMERNIWNDRMRGGYRKSRRKRILGINKMTSLGGGQQLHGVEHCYVIVNETNHKPNVIMLIGEVHGGQTCGDIDYVSAYKTFLQYNEVNTKMSIDIFIEVANRNVILNREETTWMHTMRNAFQDCYVFYNRDADKCVFRHARFHWADPVWNIPEWLSDLHNIPYKELLQDKPDARKGVDKYKRILQEITSEDDLQKIIFQNPHIVKQGERCKIKNWQLFILEQYTKLYGQWKEHFCSEWESNPENYWWEYGMFDTRRFAMDVYAFLRMFRKKEQQHRKWTVANRFENIIYHAGTFHMSNMKQMLLSLRDKNMKFNVVKETHADETVNACNISCRVDFMEFLKICQEKKSIRSRFHGFFKKRTATKASPIYPFIPTMTFESLVSPTKKRTSNGGYNSKTRKMKTNLKISRQNKTCSSKYNITSKPVQN